MACQLRPDTCDSVSSEIIMLLFIANGYLCVLTWSEIVEMLTVYIFLAMWFITRCIHRMLPTEYKLALWHLRIVRIICSKTAINSIYPNVRVFIVCRGWQDSDIDYERSSCHVVLYLAVPVYTHAVELFGSQVTGIKTSVKCRQVTERQYSMTADCVL